MVVVSTCELMWDNVFCIYYYWTGEDLNNKARNQYQAEQLREWALEQQREREQAKKSQEKADRLYELKMKELDQRAMELQKAEEECRKAINWAQADYNKALVSYLHLQH